MRALAVARALCALRRALAPAARGGARGAAGADAPDQAVAVALQRNRDVIAARLDIEAARAGRGRGAHLPEPDARVRAREPGAGHGNTQDARRCRRSPGFFGQPVQTRRRQRDRRRLGRSAARASRAAERGVEHSALQVEDALREIVYAVRSAFADVVREQSERQLARDIARPLRRDGAPVAGALSRRATSPRPSCARSSSRGCATRTRSSTPRLQLDLARSKLAALLGLAAGAELPGAIADASRRGDAARFDLPALIARALEQRPDLRAAGAARVAGRGAARARREREACPTSRWARPTRTATSPSRATTRTRSALTLSLPLPLFDRNQAEHRPRPAGHPARRQRRASGCASRSSTTSPRRCAGDARATLLAVFERPAGGDVPGRRPARPTRAACSRAPRPRCGSPRSRTRRARSRCSSCSRRSAPTWTPRRNTCARCYDYPPGSGRRVTTP